MSLRATLLLVLLTACAATGPVALSWNEAACTHCHMTLADRRFGAEIITTQGRALPFDDAGCAAEHLVQGEVAAADVSSIWVIDFTHPDSLVPAATAVFIRSASFLSPMGSGIVAVGDREAASRFAAEAGGTLHTWDEVLGLARADSLRPR